MPYRVLIAAALVVAWVVLAGLAGNAVSDLNQASGVLLTNLDGDDTPQNEQPAAALAPVRLGPVSMIFLSVDAAEPIAWQRHNDDSYQLNCAFLL